MRELPPDGATPRDRDHAINQLVRGRSNATGTVTLAASVTTTVVPIANGNSSAEVFLFQRTANAAAEAGAGGLYAVMNADALGFTITHANNAQTDRTFGYLVVGG